MVLAFLLIPVVVFKVDSLIFPLVEICLEYTFSTNCLFNVVFIAY